MKRKPTPKQRVLKRFPEARCYEWRGPAYCVYPGKIKIVRGKRNSWLINNTLNVSDKSRRAAWADAARRLK